MLLTESNNVTESDHCGVQLKVKLSIVTGAYDCAHKLLIVTMTFFGFPLQIKSLEAFTVECMFPSCARDCHSFKRKSHSAIYMLNVYTWEVVNIPMHCSLIVVIK